MAYTNLRGENTHYITQGPEVIKIFKKYTTLLR